MFLISIQCAIQCLLFWFFAPSVWLPGRVVGGAVIGYLVMWILQGGLSEQYYPLLGSAPIVLSIWSRLPQIALNWKQGHTGQLALITFGLSGLGNLARVFTTIKQTPDDTISVLSMGVAAVLNFILVTQIVVYWNSNQDEKKRK
jgi:mannose-P-dolichol utilization defect 1